MAQDNPQGDEDDPLAVAIHRLDQALGMLETKLAARAEVDRARANDDGEADLFDSDRARLAADLETARAREKALEQVAAEASAALGRAAAEVRAALSAEER